MALPARAPAAAPSTAPVAVDVPAAEQLTLTRLPAVMPPRLLTAQLPALPLRRPRLELGLRILHGVASLVAVAAFVAVMILGAVALGGQP